MDWHVVPATNLRRWAGCWPVPAATCVRRRAQGPMQELVAQADRTTDLYVYFGVEPPVEPVEVEEVRERRVGGLMDGL